MRKMILFAGLITIGFLMSCGTTPNVHDDSVPLEKSATITFQATWTVKVFNEIAVQLKKSAMMGTEFTIPAGKSTFILDLDTGKMISHTRYIGKNISFSYDFEAGKEYSIWFWFTNDAGEIDGKGAPSLIVSPKGDNKKVITSMKLKLN